jgi:hypothetical protein
MNRIKENASYQKREGKPLLYAAIVSCSGDFGSVFFIRILRDIKINLKFVEL